VEKSDLADLLAQLDEETRHRWEQYLQAVDDEVSERGPVCAREHLEKALGHLLAAGWTLHRCFDEEKGAVLRPLGDAATTIESLRVELERLSKKPEWSQ
jgi:hypothetical protein